MKRTRQVSAEEAEAWLREHPGQTVKCSVGELYRSWDGKFQNWQPWEGLAGVGHWYDGSPLCSSPPYTITEDIPDEPDHFKQQRDELEKWMLEKQPPRAVWLSYNGFPIYSSALFDEGEITTIDKILLERNELRKKLQEEQKETNSWKTLGRCWDMERERLDAQLEKLKAENKRLHVQYTGRDKTKKGYQWKNCAEHEPEGVDPVMIRHISVPEEEFAIAYHYACWTVHAGSTEFELPDPENWEFLELEE